MLENRGVEPDVVQQRIDWAKTATDYLLIHSVALVACAAATLHFPEVKLLRAACGLFLLGMLLFSGSLLALAITGNSVFAKVAPWGGTTLIVGWLLVAVGGLLAPGRATDGSE
jgi:uncharacterized membrane protein YgdD (TMEM256/DUF423 family)